MKHRIVLWTAASFFVANGWAAYFSVARGHGPLEPVVLVPLRMTLPVANIGLHYTASVTMALLATVAPCALLGLVVATAHRQFRHSRLVM